MKIAEYELKQLLIDINFVAKYKGNRHGVHDCIDNSGLTYPSEYLQDRIIQQIEKEGFKPSKPLTDFVEKRTKEIINSIK